MVKETCSIIFKGDIKPGFEVDMVQKGLAVLLKIEEHMAVKLFSEGSLKLKTGLDKPTAEKYQRALMQIGAIVYVSDASDEFEDEEMSNSLLNNRQSEESSRRDVPLKFSNSSRAPKALDTDLSDPGVTLIELKPIPQIKFDISGFSLAEAGENIIPPNTPIRHEFDLNHLSLETTTKGT